VTQRFDVVTLTQGRSESPGVAGHMNDAHAPRLRHPYCKPLEDKTIPATRGPWTLQPYYASGLLSSQPFQSPHTHNKNDITYNMSALDPSGPSQPTLSQAYTTPGNPSTKNPAEQSQADLNAHDNSQKVDQRIPREQVTQGEGTAKAPGGGVHGAPAGEESKGLTHEDVGRHKELDGEQMAMPGEGRVAEAVSRNDQFGMGGGGEQPDFAANLDR